MIIKNAPDVIYYDDFKFAVPKTIRFLKKEYHGNIKKMDEYGNSRWEKDSYLKDQQNIHWQQIFTDILKGHNSDDATSFQKDVVEWYGVKENDPNVADSRVRNMGKYLNNILKEWIKTNKNNIENFEISKRQAESEKERVFDDYQISVISGNNSYQMNERSKGLQWSFCFHILTRIRKNRHDSGFIFLLDEPANNLHIRPQSEMLKHLNDLCKGKNNSVIYSTHAPELIGTQAACYQHTFVAKNASNELQDTNIKLFKLPDVSKSDIDIQDIEPIFAKLSYQDIKQLGKDAKGSDSGKWKTITERIKGSTNLSDLANGSTIIEFVTNIIGKLL